MSHKGRCFRDRRRTKARKLRQRKTKARENLIAQAVKIGAVSSVGFAGHLSNEVLMHKIAYRRSRRVITPLTGAGMAAALAAQLAH